MYLRDRKFRMPTLQSTFPFIPRGVWMATIDLQDAYFHVSIHPRHRRYLRFAVGDLHFVALPFGSVSFSQGLHEVCRGDCGSSASPGHSDIPVPRRLASAGRLRTPPAFSSSSNPVPSAFVGGHCKF